MPPLRAILALLLSATAALGTASGDADPYRFVEVPACKSSIYIGTVTMVPGRFERREDHYVAPYEAKVFPFFFYSEKGSLRIDVDPAALARLQKGESISFKGEALSSSGEKRRIEGSATPEDAVAGRLKIRIYVTHSIRLSFPASYRFVLGKTS